MLVDMEVLQEDTRLPVPLAFAWPAIVSHSLQDGVLQHQTQALPEKGWPITECAQVQDKEQCAVAQSDIGI